MNDKIREKVLNMAIHGQLVENDSTLKAVDVKEIKDSSLFDIPENWKWTELRSIVQYQNGYAFNSSEMEKNGDGIPVIKSANIGTKQVVIDSRTDFVEKPNSKMLATQIHKGDILMVLSSQSSNVSPLGVSAIYDLDTPALLNQRVKTELNP